VLETSWSLSNNGHNHCSVTMSDGEHLMECFLAPSLHSLVRSEALKKYKLVEYPPVPSDHHHSSHASQEMKDQHHTTLHQSLQDGTELVCITRGTPIMCSMTLLFIYHFITSCTEPVERLLTTNAMILHWHQLRTLGISTRHQHAQRTHSNSNEALLFNALNTVLFARWPGCVGVLCQKHTYRPCLVRIVIQGPRTPQVIMRT